MTDWIKKLLEDPEDKKRLCCLVNAVKCVRCERSEKFCEDHAPKRLASYIKLTRAFDGYACGRCRILRKNQHRAAYRRQQRKDPQQ